MVKIPPLSPNAIPAARELHKMLLDKGLHHVQVSLQAGLGSGYLRDLFRAANLRPSAEALQRLAATLDVELSALTPQVGTIRSDQPRADAPYSPNEIALIELWRLLNDDARENILAEIAKAIVRNPRTR
jgi:transcriptional regulator with XRE-family HTH domain